MLRVPKGMENLLQSCLKISNPISCWCCLHTVAAGPVVMLIRMYLRSLASCIHLSPSVVVFAATVRSMSVSLAVADSARSRSAGYVASMRPMYALNLYFHSSNVA